MHFLYQYSLHFFLDTYHTVLYENPNLKSISDHTQRLAVLTKDLFQVWTQTFQIQTHLCSLMLLV